jgi:succinate dehydrogenase / fumarate reductase flavoprotein subunit
MVMHQFRDKAIGRMLPHPRRRVDLHDATSLHHRNPVALDYDAFDPRILERPPKRPGGRRAVLDLSRAHPFAGDPLAQGLTHERAAALVPGGEQQSPLIADLLDLLLRGEGRNRPDRFRRRSVGLCRGGSVRPQRIHDGDDGNEADQGRGVGPSRMAVYLDFQDAVARHGVETIRERYGNLFEMYERITGEDPYRVPMRIYPALHYTMGGLWVDYNLESTLPGLFVLGEANFSDHGANRLGASALMQGLADGYFIIPYTISHYLAGTKPGAVTTDNPEFKKSCADAGTFTKKLLSIKGKKTVHEFHRELGRLMWNNVGMARSEASLKEALQVIPKIRAEFWENVIVTGSGEQLNRELEKAGRGADFLEFAELLARDALQRNESCGAHFRIEHQTPDCEASRDDKSFSYVSAWEYKGMDKDPELHTEPLTFEHVKLATRSYK